MPVPEVLASASASGGSGKASALPLHDIAGSREPMWGVSMDALIGFGLPAAERVGARIIRWRRRTKWVSSDATIKTHSYAAALRCSAHGHAAEHVVLMVLAGRRQLGAL